MSTDDQVDAESLVGLLAAAENGQDAPDRLLEQIGTDASAPLEPDAQAHFARPKGNGAALALVDRDEDGEAAEETDPFTASAEDVAAEETRGKAELFAWADSALGLDEAELELALDAAVKRFGRS